MGINVTIELPEHVKITMMNKRILLNPTVLHTYWPFKTSSSDPPKTKISFSLKGDIFGSLCFQLKENICQLNKEEKQIG